jgi:hypothetical protein
MRGLTLCLNAQKQLSELELLQKKQALQAQVHKLQMLLRMAEITKLEEHIKCTRRSDSVKEEKMGESDTSSLERCCTPKT